MAADSTVVDVICPEVELLTKIETNLLCPVNGCGKLLPNTSSLRMHLVKTHSVITNTQEDEVFDRSSHQNNVRKKTLYCCPVDGCVRGRNAQRPFNRLAHVKQHYMTVHGEKKFTCKNCAKKFGRNDACLRHEKACGKVFPCSCGCPFNSRTSMLTHAKRNGHVVPECKTTNRVGSYVRSTSDGEDKSLSDPSKGLPLCISVLPIVDKKLTVFRPLRPKRVLANVETQTEQPVCFCADVTTRCLVQNDKSVTIDIPYPRPELVVSCEYTQTMDIAQKMDEAYTQTIGEAYMQTIDEANTQKMDEAYTQTIEKAFTQTILGEAYTQTMDEANTQTMDEAYTQTSFIADEQHFDMDFTMDNNFGTNEEFKEHTNSQTQTTLEFAFEGFPLFEDNETQTLESYLEFDPSNITIDCATQTKNIFDEIFSVDMETQTLLPVIDFVEEQLGDIRCNPVMDSHETQTLENIYLNTGPGACLIASAHGTQTSFNMVESSSTISSVEL